MILWLRASVLDKVFSEVIDDSVVLTVHRNDDTVLLRLFQNLIELIVLQHKVISHVDFETGDPVLLCDLPHLLQDRLVDMLDHSVESIIDHCLPVCDPVIFLHLMPQAASFRAECHMIHDSGGATACRRHSSVIEIVHRPVFSYLKIHVSMYVYSSREHIFPGRVDHFCPVRLQVVPDHLYLLVLDQDIRLKYL